VESLPPTELIVEDLPLSRVVRVGDECPDRFPEGANRPAAGDIRDL
jgi:hypothetical protein